MNVREQRQHLLDAGFELKRNGTKHEIWKKGNRTIPLSHGSKISPHTLKSFKSILRKESKMPDLPVPQSPSQPYQGIATVVPSQSLSRGQILGRSKKFTPEEKDKLRQALKELHSQELTHLRIAAELAHRGFKTPNGKIPDEMFVTGQMALLRAAQKKLSKQAIPKAPTKPRPAPKIAVSPQSNVISRDLITAILTEPTLSEKKKLELISALVS